MYEGLYREPVTGSPVRMNVDGGVLHSGSTPLLPLSQTEFQLGSSNRRYVFERERGVIKAFRVEDGQSFDRRYERVEAWIPGPAELVDFAAKDMSTA